VKNLRLINALIAIVATVGVVFYAAIDNEAQGALVALLGILYILALPHIVKS